MSANSGDTDQTPRSEARDMGLHCLPRSQKWGARHIWVKLQILALLTYRAYPIVDHSASIRPSLNVFLVIASAPRPLVGCF